MSVDVSQGLDMVVLNTLDYEYVPPCDFGKPIDQECDKTAQWKLTHGCCGDILLLCDEHKTRMVSIWNRMKKILYHSKDLGGCGHSIPSISVDKL